MCNSIDICAAFGRSVREARQIDKAYTLQGRGVPSKQGLMWMRRPHYLS